MKTKLLLDANLSWRSIAILKKHFDDCFHVDNVGLSLPPKDKEIWDYAKKHDLLIITNDDDFLNLSTINDFPPKVVLLKTGNQSRKTIEQLIISTIPQIFNFLLSEDYGVLELI